MSNTKDKVYTKEELTGVQFSSNEEGSIDPRKVTGRLTVNNGCEVEDEYGNYVGLVTPKGLLFDNSNPVVTARVEEFDLNWNA